MLSKEEIKAFTMDEMIYLCYDYIFPISHNRVLATYGQTISLIDKEGTIICTYESIEVATYRKGESYDEENDMWVEVREYVEDKLVYLDNGLYGILDYNGNRITEPVYREINFVTENTIEVS